MNYKQLKRLVERKIIEAMKEETNVVVELGAVRDMLLRISDALKNNSSARSSIDSMIREIEEIAKNINPPTEQAISGADPVAVSPDENLGL